MISLKELEYVDSWARYAPYPGRKYAIETLENMKFMLEKYQKSYKGKNYSIIFSDSTEINFEIADYNVCHMLGVDSKNLFGGYYDDFLLDVLGIDRCAGKFTTYDLISRMLEKYEDVIKYDECANNRIINYYKSRIKCAIFEKMGEFERFNFLKLDDQDGTKLLCTPSNESIAPYFFVRLSKKDIETRHAVSSLLAPATKDLPSYFNHDCSLPTQLIIEGTDSFNKQEATPSKKINLLKMYKAAISEYSVVNQININGDYLAALAELDEIQKRRI